jgi:Ras family
MGQRGGGGTNYCLISPYGILKLKSCYFNQFQHAPGVPKVLVGNRLHLAFKRQVGQREAEMYAAKNRMAFFEVSPLCNFNIRESFSELSRMALHRNGLERLWRSNKGKSIVNANDTPVFFSKKVCVKFLEPQILNYRVFYGSLNGKCLHD